MLEPLRIMIANNIYPPIMAGGAELIVAYLAEGLARRGHEVTVVSTCAPDMEPYPTEERNGVEVIRFFPQNLYWHWTRGDRKGYEKALWHFRDAWNTDTSKHMQTILDQKKPQVLHTHLIDGFSASIWKEGKSHGAKVLHTAHDYHLLCPRSVMLSKSQKVCTNPTLGCRVFRKWHLGTTKHLDLFCSPSEFLIKKHIENGLTCPTSVVRNGIPLPEISPHERTHATPRRFLFAARHTVEKGCEVLLNAVKQLSADLPFELWVAGKGPMEDDFKAAAENDPRIRLLGFISGEEKEDIFKQADCMIIPSLWYENAPVVIVEAAAYGMGVIGSNMGAIPEFIKHDKTGLLFEPGNAGALAAAITRVVKEEDLLSNFAIQAQTLVRQSSVENMVDQYLAKYDNLLHGERVAA